MSKIITTNSFIKTAKQKFGEIFDYSKTTYVSASTLLIITCKIHGDFQQLPYIHLRSKISCPLCSRKSHNKKITKSTKTFIFEASNKFPGKYDYSKVNYIHSNKLVSIRCVLHGDFEITPSNHLKKGGKGGCLKCAGNNRKSTEEYIAQAAIIHNNFYNYSETIYVNKSSNILIICPHHGPFIQKADNHLHGCKCPQCAIYCNRKNSLFFKLKGNRIHNGKYDYSKVNYNKSKEHIIITCPRHGDFQQRAYAHLNGQGCPKCVESKGEHLIAISLNEMKVNFKRQIKLGGCKNKRKLSFDFGIYNDNILKGLIEFQGIQHYNPVKRFGGDTTLYKIQEHDKIKINYCKSSNVPLLLISYKDKKRIPELLFKFLHDI